ncbi:MAG: sulfatase-like hydrolase/transferase [Akkermansiaceae bacterium]|nr:sulfatase-like hydrolase/transferase [Akkermansiaceae bacterium]
MQHAALVLATCHLLLASVLGADERPNIIFILVDDQGYYDLGCYGATEVKTPRLDRLAREGVRFTDYYAAAPICSPSRAGLLTGCYPRRVGNATWVHRADSRHGIHPGELTIAELLKANGYATACIGKWHLGFEEPFLPRRQGFDHYFGLLHNLDPVEVVYFDDQGGVPLLRNGEVVKRPADPAELTRLYTDEAIEFIDRNAERPFFVYLPHTMLHKPLGVGDDFKGTSEWGDYGDAIREIDHHTGRLMDHLASKGLAENTIVVYASDNGRGPGRNPRQPIQGRKLSTYEGGIRVPCIAWGPGLGIRGGHESPAVVHAMDWYPTLATMAGIAVPPARVLDGRDLSTLLTGATDTIPLPKPGISLNSNLPLRRPWNPPGEWAELVKRVEYQNAFFYHGSQGALAAVRSGPWKLHLHPSPTLYNLAADPGETKPVRNGPVSRKLRGMAILFQEEMRRAARPAGEVRDADARTAIPADVQLGLEAHHGVPYAQYGTRTLELDLYRPADADEPLPGIVCIHGGGWFKGDRTSHGKVAMALADRGFVAVTISYRLSGEAPFPAAIHDCKAAVRWMRAHAARFGVDPDRIGATGLSAGGHLTALLATSGGVDALEGAGGNPGVDSTIQAAVAMGAQTDLLSPRTREISAVEGRGKIWRQFLGGSLDDVRATYRLASPLHHLDAADPPVAFVTGESDDPSTRADSFRKKAAGIGVPSSLKVIAGAPHGFLGRQEWFDQYIDFAAAFFTVHLKNSN